MANRWSELLQYPPNMPLMHVDHSHRSPSVRPLAATRAALPSTGRVVSWDGPGHPPVIQIDVFLFDDREASGPTLFFKDLRYMDPQKTKAELDSIDSQLRNLIYALIVRENPEKHVKHLLVWDGKWISVAEVSEHDDQKRFHTKMDVLKKHLEKHWDAEDLALFVSESDQGPKWVSHPEIY